MLVSTGVSIKVFFVLMSAACLLLIAHGALGVVRKRITMKGRYGPERIYEGSAAIRWGLFHVVFGLLALAASIFMLVVTG